jgi:hypothetical protein
MGGILSTGAVSPEPGIGIGDIEEPSPPIQSHWIKEPTAQAFISLAALILLAAGFAALTPLVRHMSLRSDIANDRSVEITNFIRANAGSSSRGDDALFAIDEAMKSGSPAMVRSVEDVAFDGRTDVGVRSYILTSLVNHDSKVGDADRLLKEVYSPTLTWQSIDALMQAGRTIPVFVRSAYTARLILPIGGDDNGDASDRDKGVLSTAQSLLPEKKEQLASLSSSLDVASGEMAEITSLQDTIDTDTTDLSSAEASLSEMPVLLSGYVVGQPDAPTPIYEIQPDNSSTRALLFCFSTTFKSRGRFQMQVVGGDVSLPIQVKEELGGFTQNWPIYTEVDQQWYANRAENEASAQKSKAEIQESRTKITGLRSEFAKNISEFNGKICEVSESCGNNMLGK